MDYPKKNRTHIKGRSCNTVTLPRSEYEALVKTAALYDKVVDYVLRQNYVDEALRVLTGVPDPKKVSAPMPDSAENT